MNPKEKLAALQKAMRETIETAKAVGRDLTDTEVADVEAKATAAIELKDQIARGEKSMALMDRIGNMKHDAYDNEDNPIATGHAARWAQKSMKGFRESGMITPDGQKAVMSGAFSVPALLSPVVIDAAPRTVLDLIPVVTDAQRDDSDGDTDAVILGRGARREGNNFTYLRQTLRENNAKAVPDEANKPVSRYGFEEVNDTFRVYANKTEPMPWRYLADYESLEGILRTQLAEDTLAAIEADVLNGDGEADRFTGIMQTSGVLVEEFAGDVLTTISNAKYALIGRERQLNGWAMNPMDLKAIEMQRTNGATGAFLFRSRQEIEEFAGAPIVTSTGVPVGTAIAADWRSSELIPMRDDELVLDTTQRTVNNTFLFMFEGRYGFRVKTGSDFVKVRLTEI